MKDKTHTGVRRPELWALAGIALVLLVFNLNLLFENFTSNVLLLGVLALIALTFFLLHYKEATLYFLVFTIPLSLDYPVGNNNTVNGPSELIAVGLCLYFLIVQLGGKPAPKALLRHPLSLLLLADLAWMLVTTFFSQMPEVSLKRWIIRAVYLSVYYFLFSEFFLKDLNKVPRLFIFYVLGLIGPIFYYLFRHQAIGFAIQGSSLLCQPFYNDHTVFGAALAFFLPFLYYYTFRHIKKFSYRVFFGFLSLLILAATFFTYSRAAWLSLLCAGGVYLIFKWKIKTRTIVAFVVLLLAGLFVVREDILDSINRNKEKSHGGDVSQHFKSVTNISTDASNTERLNRWKCAWRMFEEKPFVGFGPGTYQFYYGEYQVSAELNNRHSTYSGDKGHAHSEYLNYLSETGWPGLAIFLTIMVGVFVFARRVLKRTEHDKNLHSLCMVLTMGLVTFYVHSFFNGFIENDKMAMPLFSSVAALVAIEIKTRNAGGSLASTLG